MQLVDKNNPITVDELQILVENSFGSLVKGVVDVKEAVIAIDAEMHADEEAFLLERGSKQSDLWGINLYPEFFNTPDFIEYDSMINLRPSQQNRSRGVEDEGVRKTIQKIVNLVIRNESYPS